MKHYLYVVEKETIGNLLLCKTINDVGKILEEDTTSLERLSLFGLKHKYGFELKTFDKKTASVIGRPLFTGSLAELYFNPLFGDEDYLRIAFEEEERKIQSFYKEILEKDRRERDDSILWDFERREKEWRGGLVTENKDDLLLESDLAEYRAFNLAYAYKCFDRRKECVLYFAY